MTIRFRPATALALAACLLAMVLPAHAMSGLNFTLHRMNGERTGNTLLVVGGIQGDEPGGFNAASLLVSHYTIKKGNVWVVPNLNFISIINRSRGVYGDLNRKFSALGHSDPEYLTIKKIKSIIMDNQVDMVLNLHDGSGFYRDAFEDAYHNPDRWGQSVIIDQAQLGAPSPWGDLHDIARTVARTVNARLYDPEHALGVKNTRTRDGDEEMAKTLTFFAINHGKPAFGQETSKAFPTHIRAFYHLRMLEAFMDTLGIEYERDFDLSAGGVRQAINSNLALAFYDNRILLDLDNARSRLNYFPLQKGAALSFTPSNPLLAVVGEPGRYKVYYGNRNVTHLHPQYFEFDHSLAALHMRIDGQKREVPIGAMVGVGDNFLVEPHPGYRVNIIGFTGMDTRCETGVNIRRNDIAGSYSVDRDGQIFRVEVYRGEKFTGMVLVDFQGRNRDVRLLGNQAVSMLPPDHDAASAPANPSQGR
ncbi:MAG: M99 family carboxypeptidase catalytic domain-containing protein [Desulfovibrionaceae bacterium]